MLVKDILMEAQRIPHVEDLLIDYGYSGGIKALDILSNVISNKENSDQNLLIKWDGRPAVIFGRKANGSFVLTDKSGFTAKTYDGLFTSREKLKTAIIGRGKGRERFSSYMVKLWGLLEKSVPLNFRGFLQGDVLYFSRPKINEFGDFEFTPNTVTYTVNPNSEIGKLVKNSSAAVVVHTYYKNPGDSPTLITDLGFLSPPKELLIINSAMKAKPEKFSISKKDIKEVRQQLKTDKNDIDKIFRNSPKELISIIKTYINQEVRRNSLLSLTAQTFIEWLKTTPSSLVKSQTKRENVLTYCLTIKKELNSLFRVWGLLYRAKKTVVDDLHEYEAEGDILSSIDNVPGGEGFVVSGNKSGEISKLVDRLKFSRANFMKND